MLLKNLFFAFILSLIATGCDLINTGGGGIEIVPEPELKLTVSHDTVPYGGQMVTVTVEAKYVAYTDNNINIKRNGASWEDSVFIEETTELIVSAFNKFGTSVKEKRTITVLPAPVIPTRTDTISSRYWRFIALDRKKINDSVWVKAFDLVKREIEGHYFFHARGWYEGIYEGSSFLSCSWDWVDKTHIKIGTEVNEYIMTDKELILYDYDEFVVFRYTYRR